MKIKKKMLLLLLSIIFISCNEDNSDSDTVEEIPITNNFTDISFRTEDNVFISASIKYPTNASLTNIPAIILIHQGGSSKNEWTKSTLLNEQLYGLDYVFMAYDIRQHGDSGDDQDSSILDLFNNPDRAPLDLLSAIKYLELDPRVDAQRIAVMGSSLGGNLACLATTSDDYNIKCAVSISPKTSAVQNLSGQIETIAPKNTFYIASSGDDGGNREFWANELYDITSENKEIAIASDDNHGTAVLVFNQNIITQVIDWFTNNL